MSFVITIVEKRTVTKVAGKDWEQIGEEPTTKEDVNKSYNPTAVPPMKAKFGYTPAIEKQSTEDVEVLKQEVAALDLTSVIKAINRIPQ